MIGALTPRSRLASNMTTAVVFRLIEQEHPTLLIDEADTFLNGKGDLRGILNSGHTPAGAFVWRCDGPEHQPRSYSTWCPMVIAGIGTVWPALQTRSIEIKMRRRAVKYRSNRVPTTCLECRGGAHCGRRTRDQR